MDAARHRPFSEGLHEAAPRVEDLHARVAGIDRHPEEHVRLRAQRRCAAWPCACGARAAVAAR